MSSSLSHQIYLSYCLPVAASRSRLAHMKLRTLDTLPLFPYSVMVLRTRFTRQRPIGDIPTVSLFTMAHVGTMPRYWSSWTFHTLRGVLVAHVELILTLLTPARGEVPVVPHVTLAEPLGWNRAEFVRTFGTILVSRVAVGIIRTSFTYPTPHHKASCTVTMVGSAWRNCASYTLLTFHNSTLTEGVLCALLTHSRG